MTSSARSNWLIPAGLLVLAAVPVLAGGLRLAEFAGGAQVLPDGDRITSAPLPVIAHIVAVTVFSVLGAFQFAPRFRRRHRRWHRVAGRLLIPCGLLTALSGLWLTLFLPPGPFDSDALVAVRVVVSVAMAGSIVLGFGAVRRRDFGRHRAWMIRGYAIGMGAGTQFFTQLAWLAAVGPLTTSGRTGTMTAAWLINVVLAEWIIRRAGGTVGAPPAVRGRRARQDRAIPV
ncbi:MULTISPECIES: DUF2306 domain-containing protein [unclassified Micromonospora]|uniref:DUF2306 domain-containing protein n=1 Tax=unclassified Micromonospora TaxID=2617518 RepID=UPI0022B71FF4|nr:MULTISPECIES: DUF2306 domain-containing protein [unclassified Micromonospora]MCZ7422803.1 DUF2306 domain-containing protein [Verrucosispora sp. WMMA2121]WBB90541.1 DUF2306 domain-containing protein [Verrucosispora sp. WMMC514]